MSLEAFSPVKGYEDRYMVTSWGRVYDSFTGRFLNQQETKKGYLRVDLFDEFGIRHHYKVHRLVAVAFVPGYAEDLQVNHKDADKTNNCADNLEWVTAKGNHDASYNVRMMKAKGTHVTQYKTNGEVVAHFFSIREANRVTGIDAEKIGNAVRAGGGMAGGHFWKKGFAK